MAIVTLDVAPSSVTLQLLSNTGLYASPLIASAQTIDRGGLKWKAIYNYTNVSSDRRADLMGLIASLRGQANRVRVKVYDDPKRGGYGGTPLVDGGSQTGSALDIDGCSNKTDWIRAGDYFSVDVNGEHELKMCTVDLNTSGGGGTLNFEPRLRASPANNAAIYVGDGGNVPEGVFVLEGNAAGWSSKPFQTTTELSQVVLTFIEDVFATQ